MLSKSAAYKNRVYLGDKIQFDILTALRNEKSAYLRRMKCYQVVMNRKHSTIASPADAYSKPCQILKMELLDTILNGFQPVFSQKASS